jgi:transposase-like protein
MRKRLKKVLQIPLRTYCSYSESFKIKVVKEVESGVITKEQARRRYGIKGKSAVLNWCRKYGRYEHLGMSRLRFTTGGDESEELRELRAEKAALEAELKASKLKVASLEVLIEVADQMYSTDLKKKLGLRGRKR